MISNYFKIAWRNLLKNKTYSIINILGLVGGTVCCLYILLYVRAQYSFDKHHTDAGQIFRITTDIVTDGQTEHLATISPAIATAIEKDFPEVTVLSRVVYRADVNTHLLRTGNKSFYIDKGYWADSTFFNLFSYRFIDGSAGHCLDKPYSMVISSSVARRLFGNETATNKTITLTNQFGTNDYIITAVFDENYGRSHISPNFIVNIYSGRFGNFIRASNQWAYDNTAHAYVKLKKGSDAKAFESKLTAYVAARGKHHLSEAGYAKVMHLQPVTDIYVHSNLQSELEKNSNAKFLSILLIIAAFIQVIACINFMNLFTARSASRAKEIGIRKAAGAANSSMVWQFLGESLLVTAIAICLALPVLYAMLPVFNNISRFDISPAIFGEPALWLIAAALTIATGLAAGIYPAFYLSSFKAIDVLKGNFRHRLSAVSMRKGLVVFQFVISISLIILVLGIRNQMKYMQKKDLGFNKDQKLLVHFRSRESINNYYEAYKNEIARLPAVKAVGAVYFYPGKITNENIDLYKQGGSVQEARQVFYNQVDESFFDAMDIPVIAGRNFSRADTLDQVVINETAARALGIKINEAPGQNLYSGTAPDVSSFPIVGVIRDYNFSSLHEPIRPLFFRYNRRNTNLVIAAQSDQFAELLPALEKTWKQFIPTEPFVYSFLSDNIQMQYETENTLLRIINSLSVLAVFICCLGLFGLSAFTAAQRVKEVGIRKVFGATVTNIAVMLSKDFLRLVLVAIIIASPIGYYFMQQWLQGFAYSRQVSWQIFFTAGMTALVIALATVSFQAVKAAVANPAKSLRNE